jgi:hypothetical protein
MELTGGALRACTGARAGLRLRRRSAHARERLGIRHAFIGGIAVGAHGFVRNTDDVDFLVGEEAFERHGAMGDGHLQAGRPGERRRRPHRLRLAGQRRGGGGGRLDAPDRSDGYPVAPIEVLVYTKLVARRRKDQADIVELVKSGADLRHVRGWLLANAADLVPLYDDLAEQAEAER